MLVKKGDWVEIEVVLLKAQERAPQVPEDTQNTPLVEWKRGFLQDENAQIGQEVEVRTLIGRACRGILCDISPQYKYDYGSPVAELLELGCELRKELEELRGDKS